MLELTFLFILGLVVGSFLNVLIWRLDDEKAPKFWQGRSICPRCKHELMWKDNIPLLSFVLLGGKCRYCKKKISAQYPIVELTTAIVSVGVGMVFFQQLDVLSFLCFLIIAWAFIVIFFADWIYGLIPDEMELAIIASTLILNFKFQISNQLLISNLQIQHSVLAQNFVVGIGAALAFFLVVLATKFRGMGLGDVKLAFVIGFLLGFRLSLVAFWMSFILGGIFAISLLLLKRRKFRDTIALGPFMVIGVLISALWGNQILKLVGF